MPSLKDIHKSVPKAAAFKVGPLRPDKEEIFREIDKSTESYYHFHIYSKNGVNQYDKNEFTLKAVDAILAVGGEIREDWRAQTGHIFYTLPPRIPNPIRQDDPQFRNKVFTKFWPPYTEAEQKIFEIGKYAKGANGSSDAESHSGDSSP